MLGLPPDTVSILLLLLGVFGAPPLVMAHPSIVSARDVQRLRSAYGAAARTFCMPWQLRVLVATTRVDSCGRLRLTVAYLRLSRVLAKVVRLALRPFVRPRLLLAYPGFSELAPAFVQLCPSQATQTSVALAFAALGFDPPPEDLRNDTAYALALTGLPTALGRAWLHLNPGRLAPRIRRLLALLRLGSFDFGVFAADEATERPPAFVLSFAVLGVAGCFVALEPDADVSTFLLP